MLVAQLCPTLCNPMDWAPGISVHRILQARILEWVVILFSRGYSQTRDWTQVSCAAGRLLTIWATREARYTFLSMYEIHRIMAFEGFKVMRLFNETTIWDLNQFFTEYKNLRLKMTLNDYFCCCSFIWGVKPLHSTILEIIKLLFNNFCFLW